MSPIRYLIFLTILGLAYSPSLVTEAPAYNHEARAFDPNQYEEPLIIEQPVKPYFRDEMSESQLCNCWRYVVDKRGEMQLMSSFVPNSEPVKGAVAIEWFGDIKHVSIVQYVSEEGVLVSETNYQRCQYTERFIPFDSPRLAGFYHN